MARNKAREIAEQVGASRPFILNILNGHRSPSALMAVKLEQATGVSRLAWLYPHEFENPLIKANSNTDQAANG